MQYPLRVVPWRLWINARACYKGVRGGPEKAKPGQGSSKVRDRTPSVKYARYARCAEGEKATPLVTRGVRGGGEGVLGLMTTSASSQDYGPCGRP